MDTRTTQVLLIEDSPADARLVEGMLTHGESRFALRTATRLAEARSMLESGARPDVILLDLGLPDATGLSALEALVAIAAEVPIVVLTGADGQRPALAALQQGAQDYLCKDDVTTRSLQRVIRHAMERQRLVLEVREANARLERLSTIDPLTDLLNRRGFERALEQERERAGRSQQRTLLLAFDLDDFKTINDTLGHATGDLVLREVAARASKVLRASDSLARIGGDEFLALLPDSGQAEGLRAAERLRAALWQPVLPDRPDTVVTASFGLVAIESVEFSLDSLLRRADRALYHSKRAGKNRVTTSLPDADDHDAVDLTCLTGPAGDRQLTAVAQPVVRLQDEVVVAYEFLVRGPVDGLRSPRALFGACQSEGLLTWADRSSLRCCVRAARQALPGQPYHFNVFPSTLTELGSGPILDLLTAEGVAPGDCLLAIDESQIVGSPTPLARVVRELREAGARLALDHVGGGRASLEALIRLEPEVAKFDTMPGQLEDPGRRRMLRRLVRALESLDCQAVAVGIERAADREVFADLGVRHGQGFLWGRPVSPDRVASGTDEATVTA